jgi:inner membrane protein
MEKSDISGVLPSLRASQLLRILLIGFLILLLQIPIGMIRGVISERKMTRQEATEEVTSKWGMEQSVVGPIVTIPYLRKWVETTSDGKRQSRSQVRFAYFLPDELKVSGRVKSEVRYRGIFKVPVYRMSLTLQGRFSKPDFSGWDIEAENILWDRAYLSVGISDARAIQNQARLSWNEEQISFSPGTGETGGGNPGINASLDSHMSGKSFEFSFPLVLNGSVGVFFVPFGEETKVDLESDWSEPSFRGNWLPSERLVDSKGFHATWNIPSLGRNYSQKWRTGTDVSKAISASRFGVGFISPVDHYRMAQRSVKYDDAISPCWRGDVLVLLARAFSFGAYRICESLCPRQHLHRCAALRLLGGGLERRCSRCDRGCVGRDTLWIFVHPAQEPGLRPSCWLNRPLCNSRGRHVPDA